MGYILAVTAVYLWSLNLIIASYFADKLTPFEIAFGRWLIASIILLPFTIKGIIKYRATLLKHWKFMVVLAISGIVINNTLIYFAGETSSATDMSILGVTGPLFIVVLSWIWDKSPIKSLQVLGLFSACIGVLLIISKGNIENLKTIKPVVGNFWMLLNCFIFAVYSILQTKAPKELSQSVLLEVSAIIGTIILLPLMLYTTPSSQLINLTNEDIKVIVYLGLANSVIAFLAWNIAIGKIGSIKTGIIYYLMPLFGGIEAHHYLGEDLYMAELIGGLFILAGVIFTTLADIKKIDESKIKKQ